jgi:hypothetical protein
MDMDVNEAALRRLYYTLKTLARQLPEIVEDAKSLDPALFVHKLMTVCGTSVEMKRRHGATFLADSEEIFGLLEATEEYRHTAPISGKPKFCGCRRDCWSDAVWDVSYGLISRIYDAVGIPPVGFRHRVFNTHTDVFRHAFIEHAAEIKALVVRHLKGIWKPEDVTIWIRREHAAVKLAMRRDGLFKPVAPVDESPTALVSAGAAKQPAEKAPAKVAGQVVDVVSADSPEQQTRDDTTSAKKPVAIQPVAESPSGRVKLFGPSVDVEIDGNTYSITPDEYTMVKTLCCLSQSVAGGCEMADLGKNGRRRFQRLKSRDPWGSVLKTAGRKGGRYRIL